MYSDYCHTAHFGVQLFFCYCCACFSFSVSANTLYHMQKYIPTRRFTIDKHTHTDQQGNKTVRPLFMAMYFHTHTHAIPTHTISCVYHIRVSQPNFKTTRTADRHGAQNETIFFKNHITVQLLFHLVKPMAVSRCFGHIRRY